LTILRQESKAFICLMGNNPLQAVERLIVRPSQDPISPLRLADGGRPNGARSEEGRLADEC
jgi:hypothetical protein